MESKQHHIRYSRSGTLVLLLMFATSFWFSAAHAQNQNEVQDLFNPLSDLLTAPLVITHDTGIGTDGQGKRSTVRFQPKSTFKLSNEGTITVVGDFPFITQTNVTASGASESGLGDATIRMWYAGLPQGQFSLGFGPVFSLPVGTNGMSSDRWAAGVTVLGVHSSPRWTVGANFDHLWDVGGSGSGSIEETSFKPFVAYHPSNKWNVTAAVAFDYFWDPGETVAPVTLKIGRLTRIGGQMFNIGAGVGYWVEPTQMGPRGVQLSFVVQPVFNR